MTEHNSWKASYTQYAIDFIKEHATTEAVAKKLFAYRELIETFPNIGVPYDPEYPAAKPPFACRKITVPDTPFSMYYLKEEERHRIVIFCIEFSRVDPNARFKHINWT